MDLSKKKMILLDGDGVLWKAETPIDGIKEFFDFLDNRNIKWALLTNNNTKTARAYVEKLQRFGVQADDKKVFTSSTATAQYLLHKFGPSARLHVVGMEGLITTLKETGFEITVGEEKPDEPVSAVVAGMDREINHEKIKIAMRLIKAGAEFIATNTDGSFPTPEGINPGTGMVIGALKATSDVEPIVIGKPQAAIFKTALKQFNESPQNALMVGDRLETDILGAQRLGIDTVAVLTGVTSTEQLSTSKIQPDLVVEDISALHQKLLEVFP